MTQTSMARFLLLGGSACVYCVREMAEYVLMLKYENPERNGAR